MNVDFTGKWSIIRHVEHLEFILAKDIEPDCAVKKPVKNIYTPSHHSMNMKIISIRVIYL